MRVFIIAEVGNIHNGSLDLARDLARAAASSGVDAVKFQTHIAAAESTLREPFRVKAAFCKDKSRYDYWKRMEFSAREWDGLAKFVRKQGVAFLSTPFSEEAVDVLERVGVPLWKIGSGEVTTIPLLERILATKKPIILSTGMSSWKEIGRTVRLIQRKKGVLTLLQCTTQYPTRPDQIGLNVMLEMKKRFHLPVGLSDHSGTIFPSLAAVTLGAAVIEVHVVLDKKQLGFDVQSSLTIDELSTLVRGVRFIEEMQTHPVDKDRLARELLPLKTMFAKSIVAARDLPTGTSLTRLDVAFKKPGGGLASEALPLILGRSLRRSIKKDELVLKKDVR